MPNSIEIIKRYKKMKSLNKICKSENLSSANIDREKKSNEEDRQKIINIIKDEVIKMYNYLIFGKEE